MSLAPNSCLFSAVNKRFHKKNIYIFFLLGAFIGLYVDNKNQTGASKLLSFSYTLYQYNSTILTTFCFWYCKVKL